MCLLSSVLNRRSNRLKNGRVDITHNWIMNKRPIKCIYYLSSDTFISICPPQYIQLWHFHTSCKLINPLGMKREYFPILIAKKCRISRSVQQKSSNIQIQDIFEIISQHLLNHQRAVQIFFGFNFLKTFTISYSHIYISVWSTSYLYRRQNPCFLLNLNSKNSNAFWFKTAGRYYRLTIMQPRYSILIKTVFKRLIKYYIGAVNTVHQYDLHIEVLSENYC